MKEKVPKDNFDINALAKQYGGYYNIPKLKNESDYNYRSRLSGELRRQGRLIEAHEAYSGRRYDDPNQNLTKGPITGLLGAMAKARQGIEYSPGDPERQIGDDICAGIIVKAGDRNSGLKKMIDVLGVDGTINIFNALNGK